MARMVRKQFYIDESTERALAERSRSTGVQQAQIVRQALRSYLQGEAGRDRRMSAWKSFREVAEARSRLDVTKRPREWTRDDAHR